MTSVMARESHALRSLLIVLNLEDMIQMILADKHVYKKRDQMMHSHVKKHVQVLWMSWSLLLMKMRKLSLKCVIHNAQNWLILFLVVNNSLIAPNLVDTTQLISANRHVLSRKIQLITKTVKLDAEQNLKMSHLICQTTCMRGIKHAKMIATSSPFHVTINVMHKWAQWGS